MAWTVIQVEEHQAGSWENPHFHGKVWNKIHCQCSFPNLSSEFFFQLCAAFCWAVHVELSFSTQR